MVQSQKYFTNISTQPKLKSDQKILDSHMVRTSHSSNAQLSIGLPVYCLSEIVKRQLQSFWYNSKTMLNFCNNVRQTLHFFFVLILPAFVELIHHKKDLNCNFYTALTCMQQILSVIIVLIWLDLHHLIIIRFFC